MPNDGSHSARLARERLDRAQQRMVKRTMKEMRTPPTTPTGRKEMRTPPTTPTGSSTQRHRSRTPSPPPRANAFGQRWPSQLRQQPPPGTRPWGVNEKAFTGRPGAAYNAFAGTHSHPLGVPRCHACKGTLAEGGDGQRVRMADGRTADYHARCFVCSACAAPLSDGVKAEFFEKSSRLFCPGCFQSLHGKQCGVCDCRLLRWSVKGGRAYCTEHDRLPACFGCFSLLEPSAARRLSDGRLACAECDASAVTDVHEARKLYERVLHFFGRLGLSVPPAAFEVDLELLDR